MLKGQKKISLTPDQQQKMAEWQEKIKTGEARKITRRIVTSVRGGFLPEYSLDKLSETIIPKIEYKLGKLNDKENDEWRAVGMAYGMENGISLIDTIEGRYQGLANNLRDNLIKEFGSTYHERGLIDLAVNAYTRNLTYSRRLLSTVNMGTTNQNINGFIGIMSKEIDRANRHYITAIETLRQMKQPELKVNIKTKNAFISQNQQFNNNKDNTNEAIERK